VLDGTQPVRLLGGWARRISVQLVWDGPVVSASASTTMEVPQNVTVCSRPTGLADEEGCERAIVDRSTNA